jgi:hypothetical protein
VFGVVRACIGEKMPPYFEDYAGNVERSPSSAPGVFRRGEKRENGGSE